MNPEPGQVYRSRRNFPCCGRIVVSLDHQAVRVAIGKRVVLFGQQHVDGGGFQCATLPRRPFGSVERDVEHPDWRGIAGRQFHRGTVRHLLNFQPQILCNAKFRQRHDHGAIGGHRAPRYLWQFRRRCGQGRGKLPFLQLPVLVFEYGADY